MSQDQMKEMNPVNSNSSAMNLSQTSIGSCGTVVGQMTTASSSLPNVSANQNSSAKPQSESITTATIVKPKLTTSTLTSQKKNATKRKRMHLRYDPSVPMSKEDAAKWRKEQRRKRNRESAASSRQKQRDRITELETEVEDWKNKFEVALERLKRLEEEAAADDHTRKDAADVMDGCGDSDIKQEVNVVENSVEQQPQQEVGQSIKKEEMIRPFTPPPSDTSSLSTLKDTVQSGTPCSESTSDEDRVLVSPSPASSPQVHYTNNSMYDDFISLEEVPPITLSNEFFSSHDDDYPSLLPEPHHLSTSSSTQSHPILKPQDVWQAFPQLNDVAEDTHLKEIPRPAVEITGAPSAYNTTTVETNATLSSSVSNSDMSSSNGDDGTISSGDVMNEQHELFPFPCASSLDNLSIDDNMLDISPISISDEGIMEELPEEAEFTSFLEEAAKFFD